jgi:hypothetical protein
MSDTKGIAGIPGGEAIANSMSAATKSFQGFAAEVQRMSKESIEQTTQTMDKLRNAKTLEEVIAIQTGYMQQSFASYADYTRRMSELMMSMPMEMAKHGRAAFQEGAEAAKKATEQVSEQFTQHHG